MVWILGDLDRPAPGGWRKAEFGPDLPLIRQGRSCGGQTWPQMGSLSTSGTSPKAEFAPGMIGAKRFDKSALALRDEDGFSVSAAEGEVGRFRGGELYLPL